MGDLAARAISLASTVSLTSLASAVTVSRLASAIIAVHAWRALTGACTWLYRAFAVCRLAIRLRCGRTTATTRLDLRRLTAMNVLAIRDGLTIRPTTPTDGLANGAITGCRRDSSFTRRNRLDFARNFT